MKFSLNAVWASVIFLVAAFVYQSNGDTYLYTYDSAPNTLLVFNALEYHRLDFEAFRGGYFHALGADYIFVNAKDGKLASLFPVGTAILTAPLYLAFDVERHLSHGPLEITQPVFERYRLHYEKQAANIVAALASVLMFLCARRIGATLRGALFITIFFAFGTDMWTVGSQALWQHGPVNLVLLGMVYAFINSDFIGRDSRRMRWLFVAGICAGFLPVVRPTAILFSIAAIIFTALSFKKRDWTFFASGAFIGIAPGILWNLFFFHTFVGGYLNNTHNYVISIPFAANALIGLLISPSKGLLISSPLVVFSILGAIRASYARTTAGRLLCALAAAAFVLVGSYAFYVGWWGGTNYGDRFLLDTAAISALLLVYVFPREPFARLQYRGRSLLCTAMLTMLLLASVTIQFVGANGEMESEWSAIPANVDVHTERLWAWSDTQIERDARATFHKFTPNVTLSLPYMQAFNAHVTAIQVPDSQNAGTMVAAAGQPLYLVASVQNRGVLDLYGYTTGYWAGQVRVRVQIVNATGGEVLTSGILYLPGVLLPHKQSQVSGTVVVPTTPGLYKMRADVVLNRIDDLKPPQQNSFEIPLRLQ